MLRIQCIQAAEGLQYIHSVGMVHGDVKASNILVSAEGIVKLSDFGNSVLTACSLALSATNVAGGGTARWMAPELIVREDAAAADRSRPADIYALGMTILEVITGKKPYSEYKNDSSATLAAIQGRHPRRPADFACETGYGDQRWNLIVECWNMRPDLRPTVSVVRDKMSCL
ncbi:hypothetical protein FRC06_000646, partial [Ceratobasidium sp. 370]